MSLSAFVLVSISRIALRGSAGNLAIESLGYRFVRCLTIEVGGVETCKFVGYNKKYIEYSLENTDTKGDGGRDI